MSAESDVSAQAAAWAKQFDDGIDRPDWLTGDSRQYASIRSLSEGETTIYDRTNPEAWITADDDDVYEIGGGGR